MTNAVPADADLVADVIRLARKGAYAEVSSDAAGTYAVYSPRNGFARPIAVLSVQGIERALTCGWLGRDPATGRVHLAEAGRRAVRRALSEAKRPPARPGAERTQPAVTARAPKQSGSRAPSAQRVEGPLAWLRRRKDRLGRPLITQVQFDAGERLTIDYAQARMLPRITVNWSPAAAANRAQAGGGVEISDRALAARDRLHRALTALGPEIAPLLLDVCCHEIGLEQAEKARGWPQRSGKVVLDMGLTALARHYGMLAPEQPDRGTRPRRWMDEGYAPTLDVWR